MQCLECQHENNATANFCEACGTRMIRTCPDCGHEVRPSAKFCEACGHALAATSVSDIQGTASAPFESPPTLRDTQAESPAADTHTADAERRQLTVMFCDLVGSTQLSSQLDPEELRDVIQSYQQTAAEIIARYDGYIAQYLGDGLLVYFGYPQAHEDDAQRAVRSGLDLLVAMGPLNTQLEQDRGVQLAVRIGIHTGLVVVGNVGGGERQEQLALGETPNIAARLEGLAASNQMVISASTRRLLGQAFDLEDLGQHALKGIPEPFQVYAIHSELSRESRFESAAMMSLTPLVGREEELGLLLRRWEQAKTGEAQVVLLSGEPGIGKSRSLQAMMEQIADEPHLLMRYQCSPYHTNTAFYPITEQFAAAASFTRYDSADEKLDKLEAHLEQAGLKVPEVAPLFAAVLSISAGERYAPLNMSPQQQKDRTLSALAERLLATASQQPLLLIAEDLHWSDPTSLETIGRLIDMMPDARMLMICTHRPEFVPPWGLHGIMTTLSLNRLSRSQSAALASELTGGKRLPPEVLEQILAKSDGIPLFVEEVTKSLLESGWLEERDGDYELVGPLPPMAIPSTLQDALMARLDRLAGVKEVAQVGAAIGREFSYELLRSITPIDERRLQAGLQQLVDADLCYQRGSLPQAIYIFKHALVQDAAYASLLKSTRQRVHQQIVQVLETRFPEVLETQPELVAHHYTEADLTEQALVYWQRAGERAQRQSALTEAISHLNTGIGLLETLSNTPQRAQLELSLQSKLGAVWINAKTWAAPEVGKAYARALALAQQVGDTGQQLQVEFGLWTFYLIRGELRTANERAKELLRVAEHEQTSDFLVMAHAGLGFSFWYLGELAAARTHLEKSIALYDPQLHRTHGLLYGQDTRTACLACLTWVLWHLGLPDLALERANQNLAQVRDVAHPFSETFTWWSIATLRQLRGEPQPALQSAEKAIALSDQHGFAWFGSLGRILRGWARQDTAEMRSGLADLRATGSILWEPYSLALLADVLGKSRRADQGLSAMAKALGMMGQTGERWYEAELHRLKGELLLALPGDHHAEAELCFHQALTAARPQQAKSWELRTTTSLARLWQSQGKQKEACDLLAPVYDWFTEGLDTADLIDAKSLLV